MDTRQAFALGLAAASPEFRKELIEKVFPEAFDYGAPRVLFEAMAAKDAKAIIASLSSIGIDLQNGEKVQAYLVRTLAADGKREKVESLLHRARLSKTFAGPEQAMAVMKMGLDEWAAKQPPPAADVK